MKDAREQGTAAQTAARGGRITMGLVARGMLVVLLLYALASALWLVRDVLFITFFAVLVASFLSLFIDPLEARFGWRRSVAGPLVLLLLVLIMGGVLVLVWPTLEAQVSRVSRDLPAVIGSAESWLSEQFRSLFGTFSATGDVVEARVRYRAAEELADLVGGTIPLLNTVLGALAGLLLVTFAGLFLAIDPRTYAHGLLRLVPGSQRLRALGVFERIAFTLRRWMAAQAMGMVLIGAASTIGYYVIGLPAALALGLMAGMLAFVPYVGPVLAYIPAVGIGFTAGKAVEVTVLYLIIQGLESNIVTPLIMKGVVKLPPALTLLFQAAMATVFGFLGLLLAVPILAAGKVVVKELYVDEVAETA
ncbi:MAG: AI-2E family transporter [Longimicrobiales bacterium]